MYMLTITEMQRKIIEENKRIYFEAIGRVDGIYVEKLEWLVNRWVNEEDSTAARIIKPFLWHSSDPFYQSIIADNLGYFTNLYKKELVNPNMCLAMACLCGSQKIGEFLLNDLKLTYLTPKHEDYILGYVSSSMNKGWAKNIALLMAQSGKSMPKSVYGEAASDNMIREISAIFKSFEHHSSAHEQSIPSSPPAFTLYKETAQAVSQEQEEPHVIIMISTSSHHMEDSVYLQTASPEQLTALAHQIANLQAEFQRLIESRKPGAQIHTQPISFL